MNPIERYTEAGRFAGASQAKRDASGAAFHTNWFNRALAMEAPERRKECREAFNTAYRRATGADTARPIYFR